jgi:hypothetical protein
MVMTAETRALRAATHEVQEGQRALARATVMTSGWSSTAADRYREAVEVAAHRLRRVATLLDEAVVPVAALDARATWSTPGVWPVR